MAASSAPQDRNVMPEGNSQTPRRSHLPPVNAAADRPSLWPLGHGDVVDLDPHRWEGSTPYFEGSVLRF
jgi:hypothetical protein